MKKSHDTDEKVTENNFKHGTEFYSYWIYIIYKLPQQPVASGTISKINSNRTIPCGWKRKEQKWSIKDKKVLKEVKVGMCV